MDDHSFSVLEFDQVKAIISQYATWEGGRLELDVLQPFTSLFLLTERQKELKEIKRLMDEEQELSFFDLCDLNEQLYRTQKGGGLKEEDLLKIIRLLEISSLSRRFFQSRREMAPGLTKKAEVLAVFPELLKHLKDTVSPEGKVKDSASDDLAHYRRKIREQEEYIKSRLTVILKSQIYGKMLQEPIVTQREGRFVVPVRSEFRTQFPGLLIDRSLSGATLFMEPSMTLEHSNDLRELRIEEKREVELILLKVSREIREVAEGLIENQKILARLDLLFALGRYAQKVEGIIPQINQEGFLHLISARHPLLKVTPIPIDLELGKEYHILVITGPNTGGKTVSLKTAGLLSLMALCGMPVPADEKSQFPFFNQIFADIGDEQSIAQNLSTFSSRLLQVKRFIEGSDKNSLVIIDELGAGTDPIEGSALGIAILRTLAEKGVRVILATHMGELKTFASEYLGAKNAAMMFDPVTLKPLYKLKIGAPGSSLAFEVARQLGLPESLLQKAKEALPQAYQAWQDLLAQLKQEKAELELAQKELDNLKLQYQDSLNRLEKEKTEILAKSVKEAGELLKETSQNMESIISSLKTETTTKHSRAEIKKIRIDTRSRLDTITARLKKEEPKKVEAPKSALNPGDMVEVLSLGKVGELLNQDFQGRWEVRLGNLRSYYELDELRLVTPAGELKKRENWIFSEYSFNKKKDFKVQLDLRGCTIEEALESVEKYLDDAQLAGIKNLTLVHGKGEGILKKAVHNYLKNHPEIIEFRLADFNQGGWGATEVTLR